MAFRFADIRPRFVEHGGGLPDVCCLSLNYRSHAGVVSCAASVVEMLTSYFPNSTRPTS